MHNELKIEDIRAVIGLGNPGKKFESNRHNVGFRVIDALAEKHHVPWRKRENMELAELSLQGHHLLLIKPQTFMNNSGAVAPFLTKQGIKAENILVVHDELELPFGQMKCKKGGSHKGHNGLRSIIAACGADFVRLRFGIGRPENRDDVPDYVLKDFSEPHQIVEELIAKAVKMIETNIIE